MRILHFRFGELAVAAFSQQDLEQALEEVKEDLRAHLRQGNMLRRPIEIRVVPAGPDVWERIGWLAHDVRWQEIRQRIPTWWELAVSLNLLNTPHYA